MDAETSALDELAAHAHDTHVVIVGGGLGGMTAALACAKIGIRVTLVEASERLGGAVHTVEIAGLRVDVGAEGYATRGDEIRALVDELGLGDAVVATSPRAEWISGLPSGVAPLPETTLRGIPENPWEEGVRRMIGWGGAWRAYLDRLRPPLTIGQERSLGRLVRTRMGDLVLERLVAPLSVGGFAIDPDEVDVEAVVPGLSAALTRTGSLAGAVASLRATATARPAGPARPGLEGVDGGMSTLVAALHERLLSLGVDVRVDTPVDAVLAEPDGRWAITLAPDGDAHGGDDEETESPAVDPADHLVIATGADTAHRLLAEAVPGLAPIPLTDLEVVTLVIASTELTAAPRRTGVYPVAGTAVAASVTDSTARWSWLRRDADPDVHVLKVTFGGPGVVPATAELDDAAAVALAVAEAAAMLHVPLEAGEVRGWHRAAWRQPPPASTIGHEAASATVRDAVHAVSGLSVAGAWVAGTGTAQVVPDANAEAERIRRLALWGSSDENV